MRKIFLTLLLLSTPLAHAQTVVRDTFTRANGGLGGNWTSNSGATTTGSMIVSSNLAIPTPVATNAAAFWSANSFSPNQYSQAVIGSQGLGVDQHGAGVTVRASSGDNYYRFFCDLHNISTNIQIIKVVGGVASSVSGPSGPIAYTMALNDQIRLEAIGTTLNAYINGVLVLSGTDPDLSTGAPGIAAYETNTLRHGWILGNDGISSTSAWEGGDLVTYFQTIQRDAYTRANSGTLGSNWTALSDATDTQTMGITSNHAQVQATGGRAASYWNANSFRDDQYSQAIAGTSAATTNTHLDGVTVRTSAGTYYGFNMNMGTSTNNVSIYKVVSGTFTALGSAVSYTPTTAGQLMRLEVVGTQLRGYIDGNLVATRNDNAITSGSPGVSGFMTTAGVTAFVDDWEGGDLLWKRSGTAIPIGAEGGTEEPAVLYEGSPQILSANSDGKIWKMWWTDGWSAGTLNVYYAESNNGVTWTPYGSNPVITGTSIAHGFVAHFGSTYYAYYVADIATNSQFDLWQSSDGVTGWSKTNTAVLSIGGVGTWDHAGIFNPYVWQEGSTYYMLYTGRSATNYSVGLATSTDLVTWTKYGSNPVIADGGANGASPANGKMVTKIGSTYYLWGFGAPSSNLPTDLKMWSSPDLHTWTANTKNPTYVRVLLDEGTNLSSGQVADPCPVEKDGSTFLFYDTITTQAASKIHINVAIAPFAPAQLVGMLFDFSISAAQVSPILVGP